MPDTTLPYVREELGADEVRFTVMPLSQTGTSGGASPSLMAPAICGIVVFVITVSFLNFILALILGIGAGVVFHRMRAKRSARGDSGTYVFTVGRDAITAGGRTVPVADVQELLWRDWSVGNEPSACSLFIETRSDESVILATNMDEPTVERLAADVAMLVGVPVSGGKPERVDDPPATRDSAPSAPSATQPMQDGDLILAETRPGHFEIQRFMGGSRELVEAVPASGLVETVEYARAKAGDGNLWLEKVADTGPAVLLPKAKTA
jgi:hypothetical protein